VVRTHGSRFGTILVDGRGHSLYLYTYDHHGPSKCYGACPAEWPPMLTKGKPRAGGKAKASLLGTTMRRDGSTQVTYRGHPLYFFGGETKAGQIFCQNVFEFGGFWRVVMPNGVNVRGS
jgi:predicted lipoprotein with Yx(FWY)xxD motif